MKMWLEPFVGNSSELVHWAEMPCSKETWWVTALSDNKPKVTSSSSLQSMISEHSCTVIETTFAQTTMFLKSTL